MWLPSLDTEDHSLLQIFYPDEEGTGGEWWHGEIVSNKEEVSARLPADLQDRHVQFSQMQLWEQFQIQWDLQASFEPQNYCP